MSNKKEAVLDLTDQINKQVLIKFSGGREVRGVLRGYDTLLNIVLDDCVEYLRDPTQPDVELSRKLGTMLCRGPNVASISPLDGYVQLEKSPFEE